MTPGIPQTDDPRIDDPRIGSHDPSPHHRSTPVQEHTDSDHMKLSIAKPSWSWVSAAAGLLLAACSAGSGPNSTRTVSRFQVEDISVRNDDIWKLNRPIDITFTQHVDFDTVTLNTIQISKISGEPATGAFSLLADSRTVRFQPSCPTLEDASDAGFKPSSRYVLNVVGTTTGGVTVKSTSGDSLELPLSVQFNTPTTEDALARFLDTVPGPPSIRVRGRGGVGATATSATYLEVGGDDDQRAYFEWDAQDQEARLNLEDFLVDDGSGSPLVPINLYSDTDTQMAVVVELDQPVFPGDTNINGDQIGIEYLPLGSSSWLSVRTNAELVENCTESGARVRLTPEGILPQAAGLRVNLRQGFKDLTGDTTILDQTEFAMMQTAESDNPIPTDTGVQSKIGADELLERFVINGDAEDSLEDTGASFSTPFASWGSGKLQASFDFAGTGGPGGDFDWFIPAQTTIVIDTTSSTIQGGPGGAITSTQSVINGVIDVRNMRLPQSSSIIVQGPNTCTILASGKVEIYGDFSVRGSNSAGVGTLNTTNLPEAGASGQAGGGAGGTGSFLTNQSTPRGGRGFGAFNRSGGGGQGGETGYAPASKNDRRGAGGGGGRLGNDVYYRWNKAYGTGTQARPWPPSASVHPDVNFIICQELIGLDAEEGRMGGPAGSGAESGGGTRAQGGEVGPSPFQDEFSNNDFFGAMLVDPGPNEFLVIGELDKVIAGAGGGGGGDAVKSNTFPLTPFTIIGDEKGAGGGGGAGGLEILAVGEIVIGEAGAKEFLGGIVAEGGDGGGGENTNYFDRVGGGSGAGSGGHVVLSSAKSITVNGHGKGNDATGQDFRGRWYNEPDVGHFRRIISLTGGQGGAGQENKGGAKETGETTVRADCVPYETFPTGLLVSANVWPFPLGDVEGTADYSVFRNQEGVSFPIAGDRLDWDLTLDPDRQASPGAGGDGSPGILQLHVADPELNLIFTDCELLNDEDHTAADIDGGEFGAGRDVTQAVAPPPLGWHDLYDADHMVPFFGAESTARSRWIPLGLANASPEAAGIKYQFRGTDTDDGFVEFDGTEVEPVPSIIGPVTLAAGARYVDDNTRMAMVFDASGLIGGDEIYRRNPNLMRLFSIKATNIADADEYEHFSVASATYDSSADEVTLTISGSASLELDGVADGSTTFEVVPHMFRVTTSDTDDAYPADSEITIKFSGTWAGTDGQPDEINAGDFTADITDLIDPIPPGEATPVQYDFFRFEVFFTLNKTGNPDLVLTPTTPRPALKFLRIPFEFGNTDHHVNPLN